LDLKRRFKEHNLGKTISTKYGIPWKLVYYESFLDKKDCLERELSLKTYSGSYRSLKKRIQRSLDRT
jgi:putative endonuclease